MAVIEGVLNNRYQLFSGYEYYPSGGWLDYRCGSSDLAELITKAEELLEEISFSWWHIVDLKTGEIQRSYNKYDDHR